MTAPGGPPSDPGAPAGASTTGAVPTPFSPLAAAEQTGRQVAALKQGSVMPRMGNGMIALLVLAYAGIYIAFITPIAFTLAVRIEQIDAAAKDSTLPLAIGIPAVVILFTGPIAAVFSDRSRARLGRRRAFLLLGAGASLVGTAVTAFATAIPVLVLAWTVAYVGYALSANAIVAHLGDRLPESQRGRVSGITGASTQVAPIVGVVVASLLVDVPAAMFLIPGVIAFVTVLVFALVMKDEPAQRERSRVDLKGIARGFWFDPRQYVDLGWVWLSRAFLFLAIGLTSVYTVYFLTERLDATAADIAGLIAVSGVVSVAAAILGAILCGFLSDKLKRRKPFLLGSAVIMAGALVYTAGVDSAPQFIVAGVLTTFAIGAYGAVDQATALDVIPRSEGENGRYLAIITLGNQIPQAIGPFVAGAIVASASGDYGAVYYGAAAAAVIGGLVILPLSVSRAVAADDQNATRTGAAAASAASAGAVS